MDIIGHLTRTVTPAVLGDNRTPEKEGLLKQFYALFAGNLADQDSYGRIGNQEVRGDDAGFFDRFWHDERKRTSVTRELATANHVDQPEAQALISSASPLAFNEIKSLAGNTPVPQFLRDNLSSYRDHIPAWAAVSGLLPAGLLAANKAKPAAATTAATTAAPAAATTATPEPEAGHRISDTTSTKPLHREEKEEGGFLKALLPIIGLIILGALAWALLKGCQDNPEPVAAPVETVEQPVEDSSAAAALIPASMTLATGAGNELFACQISAGNDELGNSMIDAVRSVFTESDNNCRTDIDDSIATDMPAAEHLGAILPLIKGTPNANVIIEGNEVRVDAPDQEQLDKLVADLKAAAPELNIVAEGPLDLDAEVENSIAESMAAMDRLGDNPDPRDVARALSLQVINFELDKAIIPDANKEVLDRAVEIMKQVPDMHLSIFGHTDNQGDKAYNVGLSERRAQAVKDYMVSQGADASKLVTEGKGESEPVATNETEQGRFRNRRIEFTVHDDATDTDVVEVEQMDTDVEDASLDIDPDLNPLDENNDDITPDSDDK